MSREVTYHPKAVAELRAEVAWHEERHWGLGGRFEIEVDSVIDGIVRWPESGAAWPGWNTSPVVRSLRVLDFPHRLTYFVTSNEVVVVAVAHQKRRPNYWQERLAVE